MKSAPVEMSPEAVRVAYEKAVAAVVAAKAVYEDALAVRDMPAAHAAVDVFFDAVRVLSKASAVVRAAAGKDGEDAFDTKGNRPARGPGAVGLGVCALCRKANVLRDNDSGGRRTC